MFWRGRDADVGRMGGVGGGGGGRRCGVGVGRMSVAGGGGRRDGGKI